MAEGLNSDYRETTPARGQSGFEPEATELNISSALNHSAMLPPSTNWKGQKRLELLFSESEMHHPSHIESNSRFVNRFRNVVSFRLQPP